MKQEQNMPCISSLFPPSSSDKSTINAICIGSGRFLRSVLVPALIGCGHNQIKPVIIQTRGRTFMDYCHERLTNTSVTTDNGSTSSTSNNGSTSTSTSGFELSYEVDTVNFDGSIQTNIIPCYGAGTLGTQKGKEDVLQLLLPSMKHISIIGVGVTEAGLSNVNSQAVVDLSDLLKCCYCLMYGDGDGGGDGSGDGNGRKRLVCNNPNGKISVICTDNIPNSGSVLKAYMLEIANANANAGATNHDNDDNNNINDSSSSKKPRITNENNHNNHNNNNNDSIRFLQFIQEKVMFHNTMVDRITSQRENSNGMVPRAEPVPAKALVIEDIDGDLPKVLTDASKATSKASATRDKYGVVIRTRIGQLDGDIALKLRVANGTHTAAAHVMALCKLLLTDTLSPKEDKDEDKDEETKTNTLESTSTSTSTLIMNYLDSFFQYQILPGAKDKFGQEETNAVYQDWRRRLIHAHFGLSTFFITQNGAAKGGIRIGPTVRDLLLQGKAMTSTTIFALAAILRFLTPIINNNNNNNKASNDGIYTGWLEGSKRGDNLKKNDNKEDKCTVTYADGLSYNLQEGWYEFRCSCKVTKPGNDNDNGSVNGNGNGNGNGNNLIPLPEILGAVKDTEQPNCYEEIVRSYLLKSDGGDLSDVANNPLMKGSFETLVKSISTLYARMVAGDGMLKILKEMSMKQGMFEEDGFESTFNVLVDTKRIRSKCPLHYRPSPVPDDSYLLNAKVGRNVEAIRAVVFSEVASVSAIDLHTHLLPPSHGALCLWGIDELLTYHYLVAEFFMTAPPSVSPESFYAQSKQKQADAIWKALFLDRSPISEACRGVITTLLAFGLHKEVQDRDLNAIRLFYNSYRDDGIAGAERFSELVYKTAGIRFAVMTNIPFNPTETQHWQPKPKEYSSNYRSALRVDPLLSGDRKTIESALAVSGFENTIEGAKKYLHEWCDLMKPEYMMASTPHDFVIDDNGPLSNVKKTGVNEDSMKQPGAFVNVVAANDNCNQGCDGGEDDMASVINENSDFLSEVLMTVCEERDLPVALKIGAHRNVNPSLQTAGDGVVAFADSRILARLCTRFPNIRFLATFLSRNNQHEACVLATKFSNLHLYGCWWFCNNPSIIEEITKMRVEMLGTAFTAQHSDARVLDQLVYKWSHSRAVIADVLSNEMIKLVESGWSPTRKELRRDVGRMFGGSYEEFMAKSFVKKG